MFTQNQGEHDLTCQIRGCALTAASHTLERWGRPDWRRSSVGSSRANERRRVPLGRKVGSFLLTAGASVAAESGTRGLSNADERILWHLYLFSEVGITTSWISVCSWNICPSPSTCLTQILQVSCDTARLLLSRLKVQCKGLWLPLQMW